MNILAIDPGTRESAFCLYDISPGVEDAKRILQAGKESNESILDKLKTEAFSTKVDLLVLEMVESFGMPVGREVFETVFWSGRFAQAMADQDISFDRVYRREEKLCLCGSPKAKDTNIRQALIDKFGEKGTKKAPGPLYHFKADMYAALAVAVTYEEKSTQKGERMN